MRGDHCERKGGNILVYLLIVVKARVALARIETASKWDGKLADQAMVRYAKVAQFAGKANQVSDEVRRMQPAINEDSPVDVWVCRGRVNGGLVAESAHETEKGRKGGKLGTWHSLCTHLHGDDLIVNTPHICQPDTIIQCSFQRVLVAL